MYKKLSTYLVTLSLKLLISGEPAGRNNMKETHYSIIRKICETMMPLTETSHVLNTI